MSSQYEREEQSIIDSFNRGEISAVEMNKQLRELQRAERDDMRAQAEEAAERAYRDSIESW